MSLHSSDLSHLSGRARARNVVATGLLVLTSLFALVGFARMLAAMVMTQQQIDFAAYYVAGRLLNVGMPLYHFDALNPTALGIAGINYTDYLYPPFFAALLRPLALLPYHTAELVWLALNILLYLGNCVLVARLLRMTPLTTVLFVCCGLLLPAVYDTMLLGQVSLLVNLLLLGVLYALLRFKHPLMGEIVAGVLFGLAVAIKIYPAVFGLLLLAERRYRILAAAAATVAATFGIGVLAGGGWRTTYEWISTIAPLISVRPSVPSNQSLRGVLERLVGETYFLLPVPDSDAGAAVWLHPVVPNPALGSIIGALLTAAFVIATAWRLFLYEREAGETELLLRASLVITLMLLITPMVWDLYYVHLLLPLLLLLNRARNNQSLQSPLLLACLLIALQHYWGYMVLRVPSPLLTLFGFLGVLALWVIFWRMIPVLGVKSRSE